MTSKILPVTPQQYRRIPEYAEAVRYVNDVSGGVIVGWVHASGEEGVEVQMVGQGHEHYARPKQHLDSSTGYPRDDAPAFIALKDTTIGKTHVVSLDDYVLRKETGAFEVVREQHFRKVWQHHTEYSTE